MVDKMNTANTGPYGLDVGIHYSYNFESECQQAGRPELWKDNYRQGHNASGHFINPWEQNSFMDWKLRPGHSASEAIQAWLKGLTIAECNSSVVAMEIDTLRASIGNHKFDSMFGSTDAATDKAILDDQRLRIHPGTWGTPVENYMKTPDLAQKQASGKALTPQDYDTLLKPGEWYYFYNHPKYLLKHPGGAWQGENSLYMGKNEAGQRIWAGLGASNVTEDAMFAEMVSAYNAPRDANDERAMKEEGLKKDDGTYADATYDPKSGNFADQIDRDKILKDPAYTIGGTNRKGGFLVEAGQTLDPDKVKATRDQDKPKTQTP
jgi:hypothetical protein